MYSVAKYTPILTRELWLGKPDINMIIVVRNMSLAKSANLAEITELTVESDNEPPLLSVMYLVVISKVIVKAIELSELNKLLRFAMWKNVTPVYSTSQLVCYCCRHPSGCKPRSVFHFARLHLSISRC